MTKFQPVLRFCCSAILAVLCLILLPKSTPGQLQDEREALEYAQVLYSDGLYGTAAEEYRRFIQNYPTSERLAQARLRLADAYLRADSLRNAVEAYQVFVDRHPDNIEAAAALRSRAGALESLSKHGRAADAFGELYERFRTGEYAVQDLLSAGTNARKAVDFDASEELYSRYYGVGWTKVYVEKMCDFYSRLGETKYTAIRHTNIYGPHDKFDLEKSHVFGASITKVLSAEEASELIDSISLLIENNLYSKNTDQNLGIAIFLPRNNLYLATIFSVWQLVHFFIPLNNQWPFQHLRSILTKAQPHLIISMGRTD